MATAELTIDLDALVRNWQVLDRTSAPHVETAACVKADGYGLGAARVGRALAKAGCKTFYVAATEEGAALRDALGPGPQIRVFSGHMRGDTDTIHDMTLTPMINSLNQLTRHLEGLPGHSFGIQLDSGMNRLGMEPGEWSALREFALAANPVVIMSHLACADTPDHPMNRDQLAAFRSMTEGLDTPLSLAATGGTLLGAEYHFHQTRPGVGLYGGLPFEDADPVVTVSIPVIQTRDVAKGESVGYGNAWIAPRDCRVATLAAGYADGLIRALGSDDVHLWHGDTPCPLIGRVSMDMLTVDVTDLRETPTQLDIINAAQSVDKIAQAAGTIGYEILTSMGQRYIRRYVGG